MEAYLPAFEAVVIDQNPALMYPLMPSTIPMWVAYITGGVCSAIVIVIISICWRRDPDDCFHGTLGLLQSIAINGIITDTFKKAFGRPRPNFFALCGSSNGVCLNTPPPNARLSFVSGHTSFMFATCFFLTLWLLGKAKLYSRIAMPTVIACLAPVFFAGWVGATRTQDYWHHYDDVVGGACLGASIAYMCYRMHYRSVWHPTLADKPIMTNITDLAKSEGTADPPKFNNSMNCA
jgi:membrane-associated phospholipid phosphatase